MENVCLLTSCSEPFCMEHLNCVLHEVNGVLAHLQFVPPIVPSTVVWLHKWLLSLDRMLTHSCQGAQNLNSLKNF